MSSDPLLQQAIDRFWETIPPTWSRIRSRVHATASEHFGITVEQFHILRHIRKGFGSVSELAQVKQISRPAISQAVDVLVCKGLITRRQSAGDRRYVELELTKNGDELLNGIFQKNRAWMEEKLSSLSADELDALVRGMDILQKTFDESPE
jgi:DNA-binding MarR family transcriptional regulator